MRDSAEIFQSTTVTRQLAKHPLTAVLAVLLVTAAGCGQRKPGEIPKPGINAFSVQQDIQLGEQYSAQVNKQVPLVENQQLQNYIRRLGETLSSEPEAGDFPYSFHLINDPEINAFALPGGPVYINSGILTNAANEAQVAGVMAHEISHVALRHGTNQATKREFIGLGELLAGAALGPQTAVGQLGQLGLSLGVSSVLLKYSRTDESQADALGARIMAEAGYDPVQMAEFFQTLEAKVGNQSSFFSDHPSPGDRVTAVRKEVPYLAPGPYTASTGEFAAMKRLAAQLPAPPPKPQQTQQTQ